MSILASQYSQRARSRNWLRRAGLYRPVFALPGDQDKFIEDIAAANPNTIVVLNVSQPVATPWLRKVKGLLQMWWTGDEGGWATAKVLLGRANPAGRLPFTWPKDLADTPAGDPRHPERSAAGVDGKTTFSEGIFVGYRWLDRERIEPQFPFGFGLSYTSFQYSGLKTVFRPDGGVDVDVDIRNSGPVAGDEVAQAYLESPPNPPVGVQFADKILVGFERIHLKPKEEKHVAIHVPLRELQYWSTQGRGWVTATGNRRLWVGGSSRDRRLFSAVQVP